MSEREPSKEDSPKAQEEPKVPPKITITVVPPKIQKTAREKKPMSEAQLARFEKMRAALKLKREEQKEIKLENEKNERDSRDEAVKTAVEAAKVNSEATVVVKKPRGRAPGSGKGVKQTVLKRERSQAPPGPPGPSPEPERPPSHHDAMIEALTNRGVHVPAGASPYMIKMLLSRRRGS